MEMHTKSELASLTQRGPR